MARRFSTGLRNAILAGRKSTHGTGISFVNGTKILADAANGLAFLLPEDIIIVSGASQTGNNRYFTVATVSVNGSQVTLVESPTTESAANDITVSLANSRSFVDLFRNFIMEFRTGNQPANADKAETGEKLLRISVSSGAVVPGVATNGLNFNPSAVAGILSKAVGEVWSGLGLADGIAGWCRCYTNLYETGESETAIRFDCLVGVSGTQVEIPSTTIVTGIPTVVTGATIAISS